MWFEFLLYPLNKHIILDETNHQNSFQTSLRWLPDLVYTKIAFITLGKFSLVECYINGIIMFVLLCFVLGIDQENVSRERTLTMFAEKYF